MILDSCVERGTFTIEILKFFDMHMYAVFFACFYFHCFLRGEGILKVVAGEIYKEPAFSDVNTICQL